MTFSKNYLHATQHTKIFYSKINPYNLQVTKFMKSYR
jgi:hypothetical protein